MKQISLASRQRNHWLNNNHLPRNWIFSSEWLHYIGKITKAAGGIVVNFGQQLLTKVDQLRSATSKRSLWGETKADNADFLCKKMALQQIVCLTKAFIKDLADLPDCKIFLVCEIFDYDSCQHTN